jgi:hypothetical protein
MQLAREEFTNAVFSNSALLGDFFCTSWNDQLDRVDRIDPSGRIRRLELRNRPKRSEAWQPSAS